MICTPAKATETWKNANPRSDGSRGAAGKCRVAGEGADDGGADDEPEAEGADEAECAGPVAVEPVAPPGTPIHGATAGQRKVPFGRDECRPSAGF